MSVNPYGPYGPLPHQTPAPPPPPPVVALPAASPEEANDMVAAMDQGALDDLSADVRSMPAAERDILLNDLAGKLDAANLVRLQPVFGDAAVAAAVESHAGAVTRADYLVLAGVGGTSTTTASFGGVERLDALRQDHADAKKEADKLNEELKGFLLRAGPLTEQQRAEFIEAFRTADGRDAVYRAEADAARALGDYVVRNRDAILQAAADDPALAGDVVELLGDLADSGHGELALDMLGTIMADPESDLGKAFVDYTGTLQGELLERASSAAASEIIARHDGDLEAAIADLKEAWQPFKDVKGLFDGVKGGVDAFKDGMAMIDAVAAGDFDPLKKMGDGFGEASPFARALSAAGIVVGAVKAGQGAREGEFLEAVQGFASSGQSGLNLLASATKHLTDAGRFAQFADDAASFARFAMRMAPGLGVLASATSIAINTQKAAEGANVGYALAIVGDTFSMLGAAIELIPGAGTAAGAVINGIGAVISAIGGFIGDAIHNHQTEQELRGYMEATGLDRDAIDQLLASGKAQNMAAAGLGVSGEQWQAMLEKDGMLGFIPLIFAEAASAYGLQGDQVVEFFDRLHDDNPEAMLDLARRFGENPMAGMDYAPAMREFIGDNFEGAHAYARSQETSDTRPDGGPKSAAERAADDYAGIRSGRLGDTVDRVEELLEASDDHAYKVEVLKLLADEPHINLEAVVVLAFDHGVDPETELDLF